MDVSNLQQGQVIKNYKEMCKLLDEKVKDGGRNRKLQLEDWERYFKWHKDGHKFIIDEIYTKPKAKIDGREFGNNSIYCEDIQELILYTLYNQSDETVLWSCGRFLKELYMVNTNYNFCRQNIPQLSELTSIDQCYIYDFYNNTHSSLRTKLETALKILNRKSLISWQKVMTVCKEEVHIELNELGTPKLVNGEVSFVTHKTYQEANNLEIKSILRIERETMLDMGYKDKQDVFLNGKYQAFKQKVNKKLKENGNISFYYDAYKIIFNKDHIKSDIVGYLGYRYTTKELNKNIQNSLHESSITRHDNAVNKIKTRSNIKFNDKVKSSLAYVKYNNTLINNLIDINYKNISNEIIKIGKSKKK